MYGVVVCERVAYETGNEGRERPLARPPGTALTPQRFALGEHGQPLDMVSLPSNVR